MRLFFKSLLAIGATALLVIAAFIALNWAPDRTVDSLKARWAQPPSQFIALEGMQVHLRDEGRRDDPLPIILIHGTSSSLYTWDGWVAGLIPAHRVVRMDLPAFGLTGPAPDGDYSQRRYAQFMIDLMDKLNIQRAILVGNSLGGGIAWVTAITAPDRVAKLVLIDAAGYPNESISVPIGFRLARIPALAPIFDHILPRGVIESSLNSVYGDPTKVTPALIDQYYELTLRAGNRQALGERMKQSVFSPSMTAKIRTITQPTLILWGAKDRLVNPENAQRFHVDIAGSQLVIFPGLGHVPQEEDPKTSLAAAIKFLSP